MRYALAVFIALGIGMAYSQTPLEQMRDGVEPVDVQCAAGLELVLRASDGAPACLMPDSIPELLERGWAIHILEYGAYTPYESRRLIHPEIESSNVEYADGATGYLAIPANSSDLPGIVMIHEWWGLNANIRDMADALALHGYSVLAVDLYGGEVATTTDEALMLTKSFKQKEGTANMEAAASYLRTQLGAPKIGSIGWCFGGSQSLNLALEGDTDATIVYYGKPVTDPERLSAIDSPVLGIFAEKDQGIRPRQAHAMGEALEELGVVNEILVYEGVGHAFANPTGPQYDEEAAGKAWQKTISFLSEHMG